MIFDDIAYLISHSGKSTKELCRTFNRERKTIYSYKNGATFYCDYNFVCGLNALGYELVIVDHKGNIIHGTFREDGT